MAGFADPYDVAATNPYLSPPQADWRHVLSNALIGVGAGISNADSSGRGWGAGIGPGLMMGAQMGAQQQQQAQQDQMRRMMFGMQMAELNDKRAERARQERAIQEAANEYAPQVGMNVRPPAVRMGPDSYDTRTAGLEGGTKNGGMVFNELGSGAFGPFQFMPATYASVRAKRPDLNLPEDMTKATREQWDQAHGVLKSENAQGLQAAGFQPTPDNMYLAHRFGVGGATSVLRADPNKPLADILPIDWQRQNPDMRGQTAGGFRRLAAERMRGVGVPYNVAPNAQPTQYALQPNALPSFDDPTLSLLPRGNGRFMPGVLPTSDTDPGFTAPVMPQPQMTVTPVQYTAPSSTPASDGPPQLPDVPKPELPAADAVRIRRALMNQTMTPEQARTEARQIVNDLWSAQKEQARARYQSESDTWRFNRGQTAEQVRHERDLQEKKDTRGDARTLAEQKATTEASKAKVEDENKLRDDFDKASAVKAHREVVPIIESVQQAVDRPTRAADLNLIYGLGKIMDPNSVVREGELVLAKGTGTVQDYINGLLGQLNGAPTLLPETRRKLVDEMMSRFKALEASYLAHEEAYKGIAERRGLDFDNIRIPIRKAKGSDRDDHARYAPTQEEFTGTKKAEPIRIDMSGKRKQ